MKPQRLLTVFLVVTSMLASSFAQMADLMRDYGFDESTFDWTTMAK
jgi:hypothetical protein